MIIDLKLLNKKKIFYIKYKRGVENKNGTIIPIQVAQFHGSLDGVQAKAERSGGRWGRCFRTMAIYVIPIPTSNFMENLWHFINFHFT